MGLNCFYADNESGTFVSLKADPIEDYIDNFNAAVDGNDLYVYKNNIKYH